MGSRTVGTAASLCREPAKASSDCGGFAHQAFLQPSGSVDCLSISSSQDPFRQESKGKRSHFDVSHEVRQGAGGEGPRGKACWGQSLLPSQASPGKTPACLVTPFISPLCGARSLPKPLGYSALLVPNLCPAWGPRPSFHSVPWAGSHAVSGEHGGDCRAPRMGAKPTYSVCSWFYGACGNNLRQESQRRAFP